MLKKLFLSVLIAGIALFNSCTDLNGSSNLGRNIINETDPTRTDFNSNFAYFDTLKVSAHKSFALPPDTIIGISNAYVGTSSTHIARSMFSFEHDSIYRNKHAKDTLVSAVVRFEAGSDTFPKQITTISVFDYSVPLSSTAVLDSNNSHLFKTIKGVQSVKKDTIVFRDSLSQYAIRSIDQAIKRIYGRDTNNADTNFAYYKFLITSSDDSIYILRANARLVLSYKDATGIITVDSLITESRKSVIFDADSSRKRLDTLPVSSIRTGRFAVFTISLKKLWADMAKRPEFPTILSVPIVLKGTSLTTQDSTTTYYYYISDTMFTNPTEIKNRMTVSRLGGTISKAAPLDTIAADGIFRKFSLAKPDSVFIYIRCGTLGELSNSNTKTFLWSDPIITGVFTNNQ